MCILHVFCFWCIFTFWVFSSYRAVLISTWAIKRDYSRSNKAEKKEHVCVKLRGRGTKQYLNKLKWQYRGEAKHTLDAAMVRNGRGHAPFCVCQQPHNKQWCHQKTVQPFVAAFGRGLGRNVSVACGLTLKLQHTFKAMGAKLTKINRNTQSFSLPDKTETLQS